MNTLTNGLLKRALSILLVTIMVFSLGIVGITSTSAAEVEMAETGVTISTGYGIFLTPTENWKSDGARFAAYFMNGSTVSWVDMSDSESDGIYYCAAPNGTWSQIRFVRMNGSTTDNTWDNKWNSTHALDFAEGLNHFTLNMEGDGWVDEYWTDAGSWSFYGVKLTLVQGSTSTDYILTDTGSNYTYTTTINLSASTSYGFKINDYGTWLGNTGTITKTVSGWTFEADKDNCGLTTNVKGDYVFSYNSSTDKLSVTYPTAFKYVTPSHSPTADITTESSVKLSASVYVYNGVGSTSYVFHVTDPTGTKTSYSTSTTAYKTLTDLIEGDYSYYVVATNNGVPTTSKTNTFTVVSAAPDAPTVNTTYSDGITVGDGDALTVNAGADFTINYTASHTDDDVTYAYAVNDVNADRTTVDGNTWSYTGKAGDTVGNTEIVTMYVWAVKNGVTSEEYTTVTTTYTVDKFVPTVSVEAPESVYYNEKYNVTVTTNVDGNEDYTVTYGVYWYDSTDYDGDDVYYELYTNKGGEEDGTFEGFWYDCSSAGSTSTLYYGAVITNTETGEVVTTFNDYENQSFSVAIKDYSITATLTGNTNAGLGDDVTLTANATLNAPADVVSSAQLTYSFYNADGDALLQQGDSNTYTYTTEATDSDKTVSIYVVVSCSIEDESGHCKQDGSTVHDYRAQATHSFTVTGDNAEYTVKVLFKAPVNWAYKPTMTIKVTDSDSAEKTVTVTEDTHAWIAEYNSDQFYQFYKWYSYEFTVIGSDIVNLNVAAGRDTFYKGNYEFSVATESDFEDDNGTRLYYFALDNLNNPTDTKFTNLSLSEYKDITISATNMITVEEKEVASLVSSGTTFTSAVYGDANCDGRVNIKDATYVQKSLANMVEADELSTIVSDFNQDGKVTIKDATAIQKQLAGL